MTNLLPCPFCGREPCPYPQDTDTRRPNGGYRMAIWCEPCGAMGPEQDHGQAAIAAWNRRTPPTELATLRATVAALVEALEELTGDYAGGADSALDDPYVMERARTALAATRGGVG